MRHGIRKHQQKHEQNPSKNTKHHWQRHHLHREFKPTNSSNSPLTTTLFAWAKNTTTQNPHDSLIWRTPMRERERESQFPLGSLIWRDEKEREVQKPNHTKPTKDPPLQPCENHWVKPSLAPSLSHHQPQIFGLLPPRRQPIEADNTCNLRVYNIYTRLKRWNC